MCSICGWVYWNWIIIKFWMQFYLNCHNLYIKWMSAKSHDLGQYLAFPPMVGLVPLFPKLMVLIAFISLELIWPWHRCRHCHPVGSRWCVNGGTSPLGRSSTLPLLITSMAGPGPVGAQHINVDLSCIVHVRNTNTGIGWVMDTKMEYTPMGI